jgi:hypothetical protein
MTTTAISALVTARLNEGASGPTFFPSAEILAAINEGQRLWCILTLCLEKQAPLTIPANTTFLHLIPLVPDYLAPLRITDSTGAKIRPVTFGELWSLDAAWPATVGPPTRYVAAGADLVAIYRRSPTSVTVGLQYAAAPAPLTGAPGETPSIPGEYHQELTGYAIYRMRQVEGGQEFAQTLPLLDHYLQAAQEYGDYVRARNVGAGYDSLPMELASYDRSSLVGKSKGK